MPAAGWDRLADALQPSAAGTLPLSIITLGHVHVEDLQTLTPHFSRLEQLVLDIAPQDPLASHRAELNRAIDAATSDWILIVREREVIDDALAKEIAAAAHGAKARGFRIRSIPFYRDQPLRIGDAQGETRLFHRRYYLRYANKGEWSELMVQGTVVRLQEPLRSVTFATADEHRQQLARSFARHSRLRHGLLFLRYVLGTRTLDANTLRYLWIEAAYDHAAGTRA